MIHLRDNLASRRAQVITHEDLTSLHKLIVVQSKRQVDYRSWPPSTASLRCAGRGK